jgi:hypothetical protein
MRKSFTILMGILVCAVAAFGNASQREIAAGVSTNASLSTIDISARIAEAKTLLSSLAPVSRDSVRLAALNHSTSQLAVISLAKDEFLTKDAELSATTQFGSKVTVKIIRANGVNTAVAVVDVATGQSLAPLLVQFPIVKSGTITEVAYYSSVHPALLSPELALTGQAYIRTMLNQAAANLADHGAPVPADLVDVAEHLCVVEHTDHKRFMNEDQAALFPEILSLYALNQSHTFRYSVSTAGAGGMIQMIPKTYDSIRQQHPNVPLNSDFVNGMRDHANALEAMLLYINDTWNGLAESATVQDSLRTGMASKTELLAAGYNSNPTRLPGYLEKGGSEWRTLIPAETQMYLRIYSSVDQNLNFNDGQPTANANAGTNALPLTVEPPRSLSALSWLGKSLINTSLLLFR